jgi:hypothetical protein
LVMMAHASTAQQPHRARRASECPPQKARRQS